MVNRLKNALWLIVGAVVAVWAVTSLVGLVQAGPMDPPGPPTGGTMKPLDQIEPRTAIWQPGPGDFPIVISQPGSYYLGENINGEADKDGILIMADNVTLDLNGFTLKGAEGGSSYNGITVPLDPTGTVYNLSIFNGTIRDWGNAGIGASDPNGEANNSRLADLILDGNGGPGVRVGEGSTITRVTARGNGQDGIEALDDTIVVDSQAISNAGLGIHLGGYAVVSESISAENTEIGIYVGNYSIVTRSSSSGNSGDGVNVKEDGTVTDCVVSGNDQNGIVLWFDTLIRGNTAVDNGTGGVGAGIYAGVTSGQAKNRIEANNVTHNAARGIKVDSAGNLIIANSAGGNPMNYEIAGGNTVGPELFQANPILSNSPWANFSY